jgi:hypothetical protein
MYFENNYVNGLHLVVSLFKYYICWHLVSPRRVCQPLSRSKRAIEATSAPSSSLTSTLERPPALPDSVAAKSIPSLAVATSMLVGPPLRGTSSIWSAVAGVRKCEEAPLSSTPTRRSFTIAELPRISSRRPQRIRSSLCSARAARPASRSRRLRRGSTSPPRNATPVETLTLWHLRLGHHHLRGLSEGIKQELIKGPDLSAAVNRKVGLCSACERAKSQRWAFNDGRRAEAEPGHSRDTLGLRSVKRTSRLVVTDLKGPFSVAGRGGEQYF